MKIAVDVIAGTVTVHEERARGLEPIVATHAVTMPAVEPGVIRIGWDDAEPHVEVMESDDGVSAEHIQFGRGVIIKAGEDPSATMTETFLDRAVIEPFLAAFEAAKVEHDTAATMAQASATTAPIPLPEGFAR